MSTWVAIVVMVVFGTTAILHANMRGGQLPTATSRSIEKIIERDKTERAVEAAYSRILSVLGTLQE